MTAVDAAARVALRTAREQGLPDVVEDPAVLDRLAGLLDLSAPSVGHTIPTSKTPADRSGRETTPINGRAIPA